MHYIVNVSGGLTSFEALRRTIERHGKAAVTAVFANTRMEDRDLYRFLADQQDRHS
jgi:orotidine-5'-phosphate decarboxylase